MPKDKPFRFEVRQLHLLVFTASLAVALLNLGVGACILFPVVLALYGLGVGALAAWRAEEDRNDRIFLLLYAIAILLLAMLLIGGIQSLHNR